MTDEIATTTGLDEWKPDLGTLPNGWRVVELRLHANVTSWRHEPGEAEITLRYEPFHHGSYHEVRLRVIERTPPVSEWLCPFLEARTKVPWPALADIEYPRPRW